MKHTFEEWLEKQYSIKLIDIQALEIFEESIKCHKAGAYRSAIIMGVIGFNITIRNRIIEQKDKLDIYCSNQINVLLEAYNSEQNDKKKKNIGNQKSEYESIKEMIANKKLYEENEWEHHLYTQLLVKSRFCTIFDLSPKLNICKDWEFWRNKRNIGAHAKNYRLISSDVESLYSWIQQNLSFLYPRTYTENIRQEILNFFDHTYTPPDKPIDDIVSKLEIIDDSFLLKALNVIKEIIDTRYDNADDKKRILDIFSKLIISKSSIIITFIKSNIDIDNKNYNFSKFLADYDKQHTFYEMLDCNEKYQLKQIIPWDNFETIDHFLKIKAIDWDYIYIRNIHLCILNDIKGKLIFNNFSLSNYSNEFVNVFQKSCQVILQKLDNITNYTSIRKILHEIPFYMLDSESVNYLLSLNLNTSSEDITYYIKNLYDRRNNDFPNVDFSKYEEIYGWNQKIIDDIN